MTTLTEIANRAQVALNDTGASTWPQATIEEWIIDGIRDYSQSFPLRRTYTYTAGAAEDHTFDLSTDFISMVLVEYPGNQDPAIYLKRRARTHPKFYRETGYYDIEQSRDATELAVLHVSEIPAEFEQIHVTYLAHHDTTLIPADPITVPDHHEQILILYALWQAFRERLATEEQDPDTTLAGHVSFLQQLVKGQVQAEKEYKAALERARETIADGGYSGPWTADDHDRIY